jgi:hypothetical protein
MIEQGGFAGAEEARQNRYRKPVVACAPFHARS